MTEETRRIARLPAHQRWALILTMTPADLLAWDAQFEAWIHDNQLEPGS